MKSILILLFFFFQILWIRGTFIACIPYRLNHRYSIYGFDQGLELCTCGAIKFIEQFLYNYIIINNYDFFVKNFIPNLHHEDVSVTIQYKFVYNSNQERSHLKSVGGSTFLFQKENLNGEDDNFCSYMHN